MSCSLDAGIEISDKLLRREARGERRRQVEVHMPAARGRGIKVFAHLSFFLRMRLIVVDEAAVALPN
jgi:hypothetical protein